MRVASAVEVDLQTVAEVGAAMELSASAQRFELTREERGDAVDCGLVVAGRFDFDEFANRVDDLVLMLREIAQAIGPLRAEAEPLLISLLSCWHNSSRGLVLAVRRECNAVQYNLQAD